MSVKSRKKEARAFGKLEGHLKAKIEGMEQCSSLEKLEEIYEEYKELVRIFGEAQKSKIKHTEEHLRRINSLINDANKVFDQKKGKFTAPKITQSNLNDNGGAPVVAPSDNSIPPVRSENEIVAREERVTAVRKQIAIMKAKADYFLTESISYVLDNQQTKADNYNNAYKAACGLVKGIEMLTNNYVSQILDLPGFKTQANALFNEGDEHIQILQTHRGWKEVIVNTLAAILGNVFFLTAAACAGRLTLFRPATDAGTKAAALANAIEEVTEKNIAPNL